MPPLDKTFYVARLKLAKMTTVNTAVGITLHLVLLWKREGINMWFMFVRNSVVFPEGVTGCGDFSGFLTFQACVYEVLRDTTYVTCLWHCYE